MTTQEITDYNIKEKKLIKKGIQKTLVDNTINENINWDIATFFTSIIKLKKVVESNENEFDAIVDTFFINSSDFENLHKLGKEIYGDDCLFEFGCESRWNISFGIKRKKNEKINRKSI